MPSDPAPPPSSPPRRNLAAASIVLGTAAIPAGLLLVVLADALLPYELSVWFGRAAFVVGCMIAPPAGILLGAVALVRSRRPAERERRGRAVAGLLSSTLTSLLVAAGVLIGLEASRKREEGPALGDVRTILSAEEAYREACGAYGRLECLEDPAKCMPGYAGPPFLDRELASLAVKGGYRRRFYAGGAAPSNAACRDGLRSFAYVTIAEAGYWRGGGMGFCGDNTGVLMSTPNGAEPAVGDGRCVNAR